VDVADVFEALPAALFGVGAVQVAEQLDEGPGTKCYDLGNIFAKRIGDLDSK
jgi:hypothetical protein